MAVVRNIIAWDSKKYSFKFKKPKRASVRLHSDIFLKEGALDEVRTPLD